MLFKQFVAQILCFVYILFVSIHVLRVEAEVPFLLKSPPLLVATAFFVGCSSDFLGCSSRSHIISWGLAAGHPGHPGYPVIQTAGTIAAWSICISQRPTSLPPSRRTSRHWRPEERLHLRWQWSYPPPLKMYEEGGVAGNFHTFPGPPHLWSRSNALRTIESFQGMVQVYLLPFALASLAFVYGSYM